jgi:hypothetical protein
MTDVTGVQARPGGQVTLRFTETGYRALPRPTKAEAWGDRLLGDATAGISVVVLIVLGVAAGHLWRADVKPVAIGLLVLCAPCVLVLLARAAAEIVGHLYLLGALVGAVVLAPLLVFPAFRRRARRWWKGEPAGSHVDSQIAATRVEPVSVKRDGDSVTVTVLVDDDAIRYTATGAQGEALEREFHAMLSAPRPATGIGP